MDKREVKCDNCQRHVPSENYQMHVVHCKRNFQLCSLCGKTMLRSEEKEHIEQYHAEINCIQCGQKTTRTEEGNHLANECGKRPIPCQYCEITLPREKMPEYRKFCGSRTEWCHNSSRYILIRDLRNHEKSCDGGAGQECVTLPCEFCGCSVPLENLDVHQRQCLEESQDFQIPLLVEGDDSFFQEIAATRGRNTTSFPGSLFSASLGRWKKDPDCGWSPDHPESGWQKNMLGGRGGRLFCLLL